MEASEMADPSPRRSGHPGLQRIDPDRVRNLLTDDGCASGYERLELMLGAVLPRLAGEDERRS